MTASAPHVNLSGVPVMTVALTVPFYGAWTADVVLATATKVPSLVTLSIGSLSLVGYVMRASAFAGARSARIVGGYGGWRNKLSARAYGTPGGVRLSQVLGDAAIEAGEQVNIGADRSLGSYFVREAAPGAQLLRQLSSGLWWVDFKGVTQLAARANAAIATPFQVIGFSGGKGKFTVATEDPGAWVPGATFTAPTVSSAQTIGSVSHTITNDGIARLEVLAAA